MEHNWEKICKMAIDAIRPAVSFIKQERTKFTNQHVEFKGFNDLVTYVDKQAEEQLKTNLLKIMPDADFLGEESSYTQKSTLTLSDDAFLWIVDPLDGTTNFIHGLPVYAVSVALFAQGQLRVGIVWDVDRDECYHAWKGGGAWLNETALCVSTNEQLQNCLLATGFPYYDFGRMDDYLKIIHNLMRKSHGLRRMGSAAIDLAYVASGRFDGFFEYNLKPWDVAAGIVLVTEAGGFVSDFSGGDQFLNGNEIVAAGACFEPFLAEIKLNWK